MKEIIFKGCGTAIITPFKGEKVNYQEFEKMVEFQIEKGIQSIIVCGTTGEASTMSLEERKELIKFTVEKVNGRIKVIAGTGSNCTKSAIEMSKYAESIGVDGLLIVTPYYNKTTQKGLIAHYGAIAKEVTKPIIIYSVPGRTGVNIEPKTCLELSKIKNIVAIKEASGDISQVLKIAKLCGDKLNIYSGNDDQIVPILAIGGIGVISVLSNIIPEDTQKMIDTYLSGDIQSSLKLQIKSLDLTDALFAEVNPIPVKEACNIIGYDAGTPRLPLTEASDECKERLKEVIDKYLNDK